MPTSTAPVAPARAGVPAWLLLSGVMLVVLAVGGGRPAWSRDEAATVMVVRRPAGQVWSVWRSDPALEPYYLLMDGWAAISTAEWFLRLPSMLAMAAATGLLVSLTTQLSTGAIGWSAGVVLVLLPAVTRFGTEARPYAASVLFVTLLVWAWTRLMTPSGGAVDTRASRPSSRQLSSGAPVSEVPVAGKLVSGVSGAGVSGSGVAGSGGWVTGGWVTGVLVVAVVGAGLMHAYTLLMVPLVVVIGLIWSRLPGGGRRAPRALPCLALAVGLVVLSPFLWVVAGGARGTPIAPDVGLRAVLTEIARWPVGVLRPPGAPAAAVSLLVLAAGGVALGLRVPATRRMAVLALGWAAAPPVALCLLQVLSDAPGLVARYWTFGLPGLAMAAAPALAWCAARSRLLAVAVVTALIAVSVPTQVALRSPDGHAGLGAALVADLVDTPELPRAAILVDGSSYRTLIAERPDLATRMPLVLDPAPGGLVLPATVRANSAQGRRLLAPYDTVLVLQNALHASERPPRPSDFTTARGALRTYATPVVLCRWFGEHLGVFARAGAPDGGAALLQTLSDAGKARADCVAPNG